MGVTDLNRYPVSRHDTPWISIGTDHVYRQAHFLAANGPSAHAHLSPMRYSLSRRTVYKTVPLPRPISRHGIRTTHSSRKPARYRGLPVCPSEQVVSHGHPFGECCAQHPIQGQRTKAAAIFDFTTFGMIFPRA